MLAIRSLHQEAKRRATRVYLRQRNLRAARDVAPKDVWSGGLDHEIDFWRNWFDTKGAEWPEDYRMRLDPESPLQDMISKHLAGLGTSVRLLDVGAGPLTIVGKRWAGHELHLVAVDALAETYDALLDEFKVTPPVRTQACDSEHLTQLFGECHFDAAHALNTLDHSYEPMEAIRQMLAVVRPGGVVLLHHYPNEAENEAYSGLHQWNFDCVDGDCVLWRPDRRWSLSQEFAAQATLSCTKADGTVTAAITKNA